MEKHIKKDCWYKDSELCPNNHNCDENGCMRYTTLMYQFKNSELPKSQFYPVKLYAPKVDTDAFQRLGEIKTNIDEFVREGKNLYICSAYTGNAKTSWAVKLLQKYFSYLAGYNYDNPLGMYVSTTQLLLKLKDFNNPLPQSYKDKLHNIDLVIFDDIAITGVSQYDYTQLFSIIDSRIFAGKSCIFTSNYTTLAQLTNVLGSRLASRIFNTSEIIEFKGKDMR